MRWMEVQIIRIKDMVLASSWNFQVDTNEEGILRNLREIYNQDFIVHAEYI